MRTRREQLHLAERHVFVELAEDPVNVDAGLDQVGRHPVGHRGRVLVLEPAGVGHERHVERLGDLRGELDLEVVEQRVEDLRRAGGVTDDEVRGPEAGVVVVVVDVQDVQRRRAGRS